MATITADHPIRHSTIEHRLDNPAFQAFTLLRIGFTLARLATAFDRPAGRVA